MMNPANLFTYEPLDKAKLSWPAKVFVWLIEYVARMMAAIYLSICLLLISVWPFPGASKAFFRIIGNVADIYRAKWMSDEYGTDDDKGNEKDMGK